MTTKSTGAQIEKHLAMPSMITSAERNALWISSDFLAGER